VSAIKRLMLFTATVAVFAIFLTMSTTASAQDAASTPAATAPSTAVPTSIISSATAGTCDPSFGSDAAAVFAAIPTDKLSQADLVGAGTMSLIALRYKYETMSVSPECESARQAIIKITSLDEDVLFVALAAHVDATNTTLYTDFLSKNWQPRFNAFKSGITPTPTVNSASTAPATLMATTTTTSVTSALGTICADKTLQGQISADVGGFPNLTNATIATLGNAGITVIKIRYTYEDEKAPAGCSIALNDGKLFMALSEDTIFLNLLGLVDGANAAKYEAFRVANVAPRIATLAKTFNNDLGFAPLTPTP